MNACEYYHLSDTRVGRQGMELCIPYRSEEYYARHLKVAADLGQVHLRVCRCESIARYAIRMKSRGSLTMAKTTNMYGGE